MLQQQLVDDLLDLEQDGVAEDGDVRDGLADGGEGGGEKGDEGALDGEGVVEAAGELVGDVEGEAEGVAAWGEGGGVVLFVPDDASLGQDVGFLAFGLRAEALVFYPGGVLVRVRGVEP